MNYTVNFIKYIYLGIGTLAVFLCCNKNTHHVARHNTISLDTINIPIGDNYLQNYTALKN